jgi:hypothetical protein
MNKKQQNTVVLHGEAMLMPISELPAGLVQIPASNKKYHIIADSETTGNHHVVMSKPSTKFFQNEGGTMFMEATEPTTVECVHADRHSPIELGVGCWEFGIAQEYDHFTQQRNNVAD